MVNESNKIIVKVGNKSNARFSNSKVYRAISVKDLELLTTKHDDCHIIIIENISDCEQDEIRSFINKLKNINRANDILFFIPDNDDITSGIADELEANIYLNIKDLYKYIYITYNINVSTFIEDKKTYNSISEFEDEIGIPGIDNSIHNIDESNNYNEDINNHDEENSTIVNDLKAELEDIKNKYNNLLNSGASDNGRVKSLEELVKVLTEEKDDIENRFNTIIENSEILEQPISLEEYKELKIKCDSLTNDVNKLQEDIKNNKLEISELNEAKHRLEEDLKSISNVSIEEHENTVKTINDLNDKINAYENEINDLNDKINTYENEINDYKEKLNNSEESLLKIEELNNIINNLKQEKEELVKKLEDTNSIIGNYNDEIENTKSKLTSLEDDIKCKDDELNSKQIKIGELENEITILKDKYDCDSKKASSDNDAFKLKIETLQKELDNTKILLSNKDTEVSKLSSTNKILENDKEFLSNTNKALENTSKNLNDKLIKSNSSISKLKSDNESLTKQIESYKNQIKALQSNLNNIGAGVVSNSDNVNVSPLSYSMNNAKVITVFGSGSFGITTTAMSITNRVSSIGKVLFIDFDMMSAMADSWFMKNPMVTGIPNLNGDEITKSSLGIFFENGIDTFKRNISSIVKPVSNTKGGGIYYLSGLYYRPNSDKLLYADYSSLFELLDNMFNYIIVDFGKFGSNTVSDSIIKIISDIAYKNVVVTTQNYFEIRNFNSKLNNMCINKNNIHWLINMCQTTALEQKTKDLIGKCSYDMFPKIEQYGNNKHFSSINSLRDRFNVFMGNINCTQGE